MTHPTPTREAQAREVLEREIEAEGIAEAHALRRNAKWRGEEGHTLRLEKAAIRAMLAFADQPRPIETGEVIQADRDAAAQAYWFVANGYMSVIGNALAAGAADSAELVQLMAAHRLAFASPLQGDREECWRDIASAPRDGSTFDAWVPSFATPGSGYRVANLTMTPGGVIFRRGETFPADLAHWPTHWRPLPEAPEVPTVSSKAGEEA